MQIATAILTNLGLTSITGLDNWLSAQLTAAGSTAAAKGAALVSILNGYAGMAADATYGTYATGFNAKVDAALTLSQTAGSKGGSFATADVVAVTNGTFTLTTGADTGASFTGGAGTDTFNAIIAADRGTGTTYTPGDNLTGGAGTDTLSVSVSGTHTAGQTHSTTTLNAVEKVLVSNFETSANNDTFDASLWTGVTNVGLASSSATGDVIFTNVANTVAGEMANGTGDLTITYAAALLTGATDVQALNLSGATSAATFTVSNGATGYAETLNINSAGSSNSITAANNRHKTINVTGDKNLTLALTDTANTTTKVDASALTGNLTLSGLGTTNINIIGGAGNDTVTAANIDGNDTIDAGAGTDTLKTVAAISATSGAKITNFEVLEVTGDAVTQGASDIAGITTASVNDTTAGSANGTITFSGMASTTSLTVKAVGDATDDVSASLTTNTLSDSISVTLGTTTAGVTFDVLTLDNYETITVGNAVAASTVGSLVSTQATKLVINAAAATTVTAVTAAALGTVDASASTADVTVGAVSKASSITGGAGNDNFTGGANADTVVGGAGNDTIDGSGGSDSILGGDGADSITGGAGNDVVDGGAGNDIFTDAAANTDNFTGGEGDDTFNVTAFANLTSADTISGGNGTDTIAFTADGNYDFTSDVTILTNVSGIERYSFTGLAGGNDTVTLNDGVVSAAGGTLTLLNGSASSTTFNASAVLASASKVVLSSNTTGNGTALTYSIGNGIDQVTFGTGGDTAVVSNNAYLSTSDTISGGAGSDTLSFTYNTASSNTITAAQLTNVTGFETFSINNATDATAVNYTLTLTDAMLGAQVNPGATFTVTRDAADTGTTKVDASAVTSTYALAVTGGTGNDTILGGTNADTITGGAGSDSLTGGAGNDTFVITGTSVAANGLDSITDYSFGTASTAVDLIRIDLTSTTKVFGTASAGITAAAGTEILVLDTTAYADSSAAQTAARTLFGANDNAAEAVVVWQDTLGNLNMSLYADASADATANGTLTNAMVKFVGLTLSSAGTLIGSADFDIV
jgi:Ca2+-binding RTX toxin-like protein